MENWLWNYGRSELERLGQRRRFERFRQRRRRDWFGDDGFEKGGFAREIFLLGDAGFELFGFDTQEAEVELDALEFGF